VAAEQLLPTGGGNVLFLVDFHGTITNNRVIGATLSARAGGL